MMGIGMAVRPPRQLSLMARAISAIRRNGGTLIGIPDNFAGAYIDSTGTTPVTAVGDLVGLLTDRSYGAGNLGVELVTNQTVTGLPAGGGTRFYNLTANLTSTFVANKAYLVRYRVTDYAGTGSVGLAGAAPAGVVQQSHTANGEYQSTQLPTASGAPALFTTNTNTCNFVLLSVREVLGNHATQPTTASKPVVTRVPKRLGPNLVVNGTFDADVSGWTGSFGTATHSGGKLRVTSTGNVSAPRAHQNFTTVPGATYALSVDLTATTSQAVAYVGLSGGFSTSQIIPPVTPTGMARAYGTFTATGTTTSAIMLASSTTSGNYAEFDNIEVRKVLEWTNAISFDGSNDFLQTSITTGNEGWVCAGVTPTAAPTVQHRYVANGATSAGATGFMLAEDTTGLLVQLCDGVAIQSINDPYAPGTATGPRVVDAGWNGSTVVYARNSVEKSTARNRSPVSATVIWLGVSPSGVYHMQGPMSATVICPVLPSAADRALIRKWIGSLQGQTL